MKVANTLAMAPSPLQGVGSAEAACMGLYRFLHNPAITPRLLAEPLRRVVADHLKDRPAAYTLLAHDESVLAYRGHRAKADRLVRTHKADVGYELLTALAVDARDGRPIAPLAMRLDTAAGVHSTSPPEGRRLKLQDQILPRMAEAAAAFPATSFVHVMDREFDSIGHLRNWAAAGHRFLVRGKGNRLVRWRGEVVKVGEIPARLAEAGEFRFVEEITARGRPAELRVAEVRVARERPAKPRGGGRKGKVRQVRGEPLELRLVVAEVRFGDGSAEHWLLCSNVPADVAAADLARWYYYRWRIECFFKMLKSAGLEAESWKQRDGLSILKRLLLAAMALSLVYRLAQAEGEPAAEGRGMLIKLSGRLMRHRVEHTIPALLAGLYVLLQVRYALEHWTEAELDAAYEIILGKPPPAPGRLV